MLQTDWQDISTAPKDGRRVLTWTITPVFDEDSGREVKEAAVSVSYFCFGGWMEYPARPQFVQGQQHTHWMPLPEPPMIIAVRSNPPRNAGVA